MGSEDSVSLSGVPTRTTPKYGSPLPLPGVARGPLSTDGLQRLYAATDWGFVLRHPQAASAYGRFPAAAMFKALALPFLIPIESEAALARELAERDALRALCGLGAVTPTRAMFWHFRHTPHGFYPDIMLKVLIALAFSGEKPNLDLPFVRLVPKDGPEPTGRYFTFRLSHYGPETEVWTTPAEGMLDEVETAGKSVGESYGELKSAERLGRSRGTTAQLELPAEVANCLADGQRIRFAIDTPDWLKPGSGDRSRSSDTITTLGSARSSSYAACNIIVLRQDEHGEQVLLSRRLDGMWRGQYVLPGGKALPGESLPECATRELREETGLKAVHSRPISVHLVRLPGRPLVFSVGAIVTGFIGEPRRTEKQHNENWKWFSLDDLPAELSLPAQLALNDYRRGYLRDQQWSDVEIRWRTSAERPVQLTFDGPIALTADERPE